MFGFGKKMKMQAEAVNLYFADAAKLYAFNNLPSAGLAALTAAMVAASTQRQSMVEYAIGLASDIQEIDSESSDRLLALSMMISQKDWSILDIAKSKTELAKIDKAMLNALDSFDGQYFRRNYDLFENL